MAEENAGPNPGTVEIPGTGEPAAVAVALGAQGLLDPRAATFLEEQTRLARKQGKLADLKIEYVAELDRFELSHLRFRKLADYARFALEVSVALVALAIVCGLGAMIWNAARDRDLVMEAFSVPSDVAQSGMSGQVLAARVLDKFGAMQSSRGLVLQGADTYRRDNGDNVRIEIPETGISLGELNNDLRDWLGHETRVTGDLVRAKTGLALTLRYGDKPGETETGSDLDALIQKAAEYMYATAKPYRYIEYLANHNRVAEALALAPAVARQGNAQERAFAYLAWGEAYFDSGDYASGFDKFREAIRLDPSNPLTHDWLGYIESQLQHKEAAYREMRAAVRHWHGPLVDQLDPDARTGEPLFLTAVADDNSGDYPDALAAWQQLAASGSGVYYAAYNASTAANNHDIATARALEGLTPEKDGQGRLSWTLPFQKFHTAYVSGDYVSALRLGRETQTLLAPLPYRHAIESFLLPLLAYTQAETGDVAGAEKLIAGMPADDDLYLEMRGRIAALAHHWSEAARDFAILSARSPDIPAADTDWGAMLVAKGDLPGAIAKFASAHTKSPHFADPLEMWGEALVAENRSDLALAKFEEANQDAPNWGRLHLKWGEALFWAGKKDEAKQQFALAANLDLSASDKAELAKVSTHG